MDTSLPGTEEEFVRHVVEACRNVIGLAAAQPSQAIGLAQAPQSALTSLQVVQNEVAKGKLARPPSPAMLTRWRAPRSRKS
ncbi:hypothetical protein [Bradyrhizobium sp. BR 1432]|uniref:hypothetical protein n=1 Tax=Bradyrhizobium sp. BR 1432 TaxID=3447966 RepID=UPI003EE4A57E